MKLRNTIENPNFIITQLKIEIRKYKEKLHFLIENTTKFANVKEDPASRKKVLIIRSKYLSQKIKEHNFLLNNMIMIILYIIYFISCSFNNPHYSPPNSSTQN